MPSTPQPFRRCIDADEVAERYQTTRRNVYRLAAMGVIPRGFHVGHLRRWDEHVINEHIAAGCPRPPGGGAS
jgi:predicted DNA-binding transcriptional regulator AlpA